MRLLAPLTWVVALLLVAAVPVARAALAPGYGEFEVTAGTPDAPLPVKVYYFRPPAAGRDTPVVFVIHGAARDPRAARESWVSYARQHRFIVVAPEFSSEAFPGSWRFQMGNVFTATGVRKPRAAWAFSAVEKIFDVLRNDYGLQAERYDLFGHSAGAQFVQRMVLFMPQARIERAVAANAGWYTLPEDRVPLPYGLGGASERADELRLAFDVHLTLMLGSRDTDPNHRLLNRSAGAMAQGRNRFERGRAFYAAARNAARAMGVPFHWKLRVVEGVGHSARRMAGPAAEVFFPPPAAVRLTSHKERKP